MKTAGVLPERRGFKSVCDGSGRTSAVKADICNPLRYSVKKTGRLRFKKSWAAVMAFWKINQF